MIENLLPVYLLIGISVKVNSLPVWKLKEIGNADSHPVSYLIENPVKVNSFPVKFRCFPMNCIKKIGNGDLLPVNILIRIWRGRGGG